MQEVQKFINWFEERSNGKGPSLYSFNKKINPYKSVKEYIVHDSYKRCKGGAIKQRGWNNR
ncbi:hypothetical protein HZR17_09900 [Clostridium botulinum]|nr:hypothetical protein [Clostridium botulinum]MBZ1332779.1 hypothetical protein [Clostridium botulinum]MBZ1336538.1 hypothetical protein [Clostridium botulinum]MBZ1341403.1 hypothetical protein [Clostridium botulinum]MBZ1344851.1 hypothetical protein [Clostridium botulinum]